MSERRAGFGKFYGDFAAAFGTIVLVAIAMALLTDERLDLGVAGSWMTVVVSLIYAASRQQLPTPPHEIEPEYFGRDDSSGRDGDDLVEVEFEQRVPEEAATVEVPIAEFPEREYEVSLDLLDELQDEEK